MAWLLVAELGFVIGNSLYRYYTRPEDERLKAKGLDDFSFPRAEEGDAVPLAYGMNRIDSPIVIYFFPDPLLPVTDSDYGPIYHLHMRMLLCRSNARVDDANPPRPQLLGITIGDRVGHKIGPGRLESQGGAADTDGCSTWFLSSGFANQGEVAVNVDPAFFYDGRWDLARHPAEAVYDSAETPIVPYRGLITMGLQRFDVVGTQIPTIAPTIYNPVCIPGYEAQTGPLALGDCNPIAILYDLWTNPWGGCGNDSASVDLPSFLACAATLVTEQHGMSLMVTKPNEARTIMEEILRQIDGVGYVDMATGKLVVNLIRADYDPGTIPEFTMSNVVEAPEMPSTLWSETVNEVRVIFTEPRNNYRPATAIEQDLASIAINGGRVRSREFRFPGIRNPTLAQNIAARELNALSRPLAKLRMKVNRQGYSLKPGQPFKFTWGRWGVSIVFRVMEVDLGTLEDGTITVTAVQDQFDIVGTVFDPSTPDEVADPPIPPSPVVHRLVTEAPRWIQVQAYDQALINSPDAQRSYSLAVAEGTDNRYKVDTVQNAADELPDLPPRAFPATFALSASYARTAGPYDTVTGILIDTFAGTAPTSATATQIREEGRNLVALWDADGNHEFVAFEAAADLGGGAYQLQSVWRGLLDTVPRDWPGGTFGALLPGTNGVDGLGRLALRYGGIVATRLKAASGSAWTPTDISPADGFTTRSRGLLPARAAYLRLNSSQTPAALEVDGVTFTWADRNATTASITRGDEADEAVQAGQAFDAVAYKTTPADTEAGAAPAQVVLSAGLSSHTAKVPLGKIGHGVLEVGIDTKRAVSLPNGTTPTLRGWQVPTLALTAHHWRNLLVNGDFSDGLANWTTVGGTPAAGSTNPLGNAGFYVTGTTATVTVQQDLDVTGYPAEGLSAVLDFYVSKFSDLDDTITVTLYGLDSGGATVASTTYGPTAPTAAPQWTKQTLTLAALDATVDTLRVRVVLTAVGGGDVVAETGFTGACLRLGQVSGQLVANPGFEAGGGGVTSWTASVGTWQALAATKYESANYIKPNDLATAQLTQTVTLPAGHELGVAVLEFARLSEDAALVDTGKVTLECLDGGAAVVATATTGDEAMATLNVWERRRLTIDPIPATTTQLRITLDATRNGGTSLDAAFDDFDLRTHKHLDEDDTIYAAWSESVAQPLPRTASAFAYALPGVTVPDYAIYDGALVGRLGVEPVLVATGATVLTGATAVAWDGVTRTTTAYETMTEGGSDHIAVAPLGTSFGNFSASADFTVAAFWRFLPGASTVDGFGICGRNDGVTGWELRLTDTDGFPRARLTGAGGQVDATGSTPTGDGTLHGAVMTYVAATDTLTLYDVSGTATASTAAIGEFRAGAARLRILQAVEVEPAGAFPGQVLRVYMWRSALTSTEAGLLLAGIRGSDPTGLITSDGRTGAIACVTGSNTSGVLVEVFGPGRTAIGYDAASARWGLVTMPEIDELTSTGAIADTGTVVAGAAIDPLGFVQALSITGTNVQGRTYETMVLGGAATVYVTWMARAATAHSATVALLDSGGAVDVSTTVALTTAWQVFSWAAAWTDPLSDGLGGVRFSGSDGAGSQAIYLSPIMSVSLVQAYPGTFPIGSPFLTAPIVDVSTLTSQINREGEIAIEAVHVDTDACLARTWATSAGDNDVRGIFWGATGPDIATQHYTGAGVNDATAKITGSAIDPTMPYTVALRWNRAGLREDVAAFTQVRADQGATSEDDAGRAATWTASTTPVDNLSVGSADGSSVMAGLVLSARVSSRERKA